MSSRSLDVFLNDIFLIPFVFIGQEMEFGFRSGVENKIDIQF